VEDVESAEAARSLLDQVSGLLSVAGVRRDADGFTARRSDGSDGGFRGRGVEVAHHDSRTLAGERERPGTAKARAGTGDEGDAVVETHAAAIARRGPGLAVLEEGSPRQTKAPESGTHGTRPPALGIACRWSSAAPERGAQWLPQVAWEPGGQLAHCWT